MAATSTGATARIVPGPTRHCPMWGGVSPGRSAAAVSTSWVQSAATSSAVVAVAPTETRRSWTPFTTAGVR